MSALLSARSVSVMRGGVRVVRDVSLDVARGELVALLGRNGAGKSSLLAALAGLLPVEHGTIALNGRALDGLHRNEIARTLACLGQDERPDDELTALEVALLGRAPHLGAWGLPSDDDVTLARRALASTDALAFEHREIRTLSGGERQRVLLARVLCQAGTGLLLDEPTHALDPGHALTVMQLLQAQAREGAAVVVVLHDLSLAARFADRLVVLAEGQVISNGAWQGALTPDVLRRAFNTALSVVEVRGHPVVVAD